MIENLGLSSSPIPAVRQFAETLREQLPAISEAEALGQSLRRSRFEAESTAIKLEIDVLKARYNAGSSLSRLNAQELVAIARRSLQVARHALSSSGHSGRINILGRIIV